MSALPWYLLLLPLFAAAVIALLTNRWPGVSSFISVMAALVGFGMSCLFFATPDLQASQLNLIHLRPVLFLPLRFVLDDLAKTILLLLTGGGALIHIYSLGYMRDDSGKAR